MRIGAEYTTAILWKRCENHDHPIFIEYAITMAIHPLLYD